MGHDELVELLRHGYEIVKAAELPPDLEQEAYACVLDHLLRPPWPSSPAEPAPGARLP